MRKMRVVVLSGFVAAVLSGVTASAATAVKFEWSVAGTPLAAGQRLTIALTVDPSEPTITFKGTAFGVAVELTTSKIKLSSITNIQGGKPGTGEGSITAEDITVVKPKNCTVSNITTNSVEAMIVEGATGGVGDGIPLVMFKPRTGSVLDEFEFGGASCSLRGDLEQQSGSALVRTASGEEVKVELGSVEPYGTEVITSTGGTVKTGVTNGSSPVEVSGNVEVSLANGDAWSVL